MPQQGTSHPQGERALHDRTPAPCAICPHGFSCLPSALSRHDEQAMAASTAVRALLLHKGEPLSKRAQIAGNLFVVRSGTFKSEVTLKAGATRVLGFHEPGDFMAADTMLGGIPSAERFALQDSTVCAIDIWRLETMAASNPALGTFITRIAAGTLVQAQQAVFALGGLSATGRLAWFLMRISERRRSRGLDPRALSLPLRNQDVGSYLGLSQARIGRLFTALHRSGVISRHDQDIRILDLSRLAELAHLEIGKAAEGLDTALQARTRDKRCPSIVT